MPLNRECPKCGHDGARVNHCRVLNLMELACNVCKYEWTLKPLDVLRAESERVWAEQYGPGKETRAAPETNETP